MPDLRWDRPPGHSAASQVTEYLINTVSHHAGCATTNRFQRSQKVIFLERPCTFWIIMIGKLAAVRKMEGCRAWNRKELGRHMKFALPPAKNRNTPQKEFFFLNKLGDFNHDIGVAEQHSQYFCSLRARSIRGFQLCWIQDGVILKISKLSKDFLSSSQSARISWCIDLNEFHLLIPFILCLF